MSSVARVATTLVTGLNASTREEAIAALLGDVSSEQGWGAAVILEGVGVGATPLVAQPGLSVSRIAPGCLCCAGNLVLRVTLNRLLRQAPQRLFIGLASSEHLDQLRSWLAAAPYDQLLTLEPVHDAGSSPSTTL